jgi:hypothetical protein
VGNLFREKFFDARQHVETFHPPLEIPKIVPMYPMFPQVRAETDSPAKAQGFRGFRFSGAHVWVPRKILLKKLFVRRCESKK